MRAPRRHCAYGWAVAGVPEIFYLLGVSDRTLAAWKVGRVRAFSFSRQHWANPARSCWGRSCWARPPGMICGTSPTRTSPAARVKGSDTPFMAYRFPVRATRWPRRHELAYSSTSPKTTGAFTSPWARTVSGSMSPPPVVAQASPASPIASTRSAETSRWSRRQAPGPSSGARCPFHCSRRGQVLGHHLHAAPDRERGPDPLPHEETVLGDDHADRSSHLLRSKLPRSSTPPPFARTSRTLSGATSWGARHRPRPAAGDRLLRWACGPNAP